MKLKDMIAKLRAKRLRKKPRVAVFVDHANGFECRNLHCKVRLVGPRSVYVTKVDDAMFGHQMMHLCKECARQVNATHRIDFKINLVNKLGCIPLTRDYGGLIKC